MARNSDTHEQPTHGASPRRAIVRLACLVLAFAGGRSSGAAGQDDAQAILSSLEPVEIPDWVYGVTRMAFLTPDQLDLAAQSGVQVAHANVVWPYYPLKRDGGALSAKDAHALRSLTEACHARGIRLVLGLPPFPPAALVRDHPDWRVQPDPSGAERLAHPADNDLGTRLCCNQGPWGDYFVELLAELIRDFRFDGYSFDGNYHPSLCFCPACKEAYRRDRSAELPRRVDLDDPAYRSYLVWRGERLESHYQRIQQAIKAVNPDNVLMSWTVNAGRYGHLLQSPRSMSTRLNLRFDLPMQEWWLDETNLGASIAPSFGAAYLAGITGGRPNASEPYLMSRGNPYGTDSFPKHERVLRALLAMTQGSLAPESFGWPGHGPSTLDVCREIGRRERWIVRRTPLPWAALLVSEQTRQFYAYGNIAERYLPHLLGAFRALSEEHRPLTLINDWDIDLNRLSKYCVVILPNAAALSDPQVAALRAYVKAGGGLVATADTSLCDELGRFRADFGLADLLGVSFRGRPGDSGPPMSLDGKAAIAAADPFWTRRTGVAQLSWSDHPLVRDAGLAELVPGKAVVFRGPMVHVTVPHDGPEVVARMALRDQPRDALPAIVVHRFGQGRVVYLAASLDAALWSYAYPYQRQLLVRAVDLAAGQPAPVAMAAPRCVQATYWRQDAGGKRLVIHLFNGLDSTAHHGMPGTEVPLREEVIPIAGIKLTIRGESPRAFHLEPGHVELKANRDGSVTHVDLPALETQAIVVGEF